MRNTHHWIGLVAGLILVWPSHGRAQCLSDHGDLTGDGVVDVLDTTCMNLWLLGEWQNTPAPACVSGEAQESLDLNCDGSVNLLDGAILETLASQTTMPVQVDGTGNGCPSTCDADPTLPGSPLPLWELEDMQPESLSFGSIVGPKDGTGVQVIALLDGG